MEVFGKEHESLSGWSQRSSYGNAVRLKGRAGQRPVAAAADN